MSLRSRVLESGLYLALQRGLGTLTSLAGILLLTRAIGPSHYGLYATALGLFTYLQMVSHWGLDVYLVRREGEDDVEEYHRAFTVLLVLGACTTVAALATVPMLQRWIRIDGFSPVGTALFLLLPLPMLSTPPMAWLERRLRYKRVAIIEFSGHLALYAVAVALAFLGLEVWAPVIGMWSKHVVIVVLAYALSGYRPRLRWNLGRMKDMMGYGVGYTSAQATWWMRRLVPSLVVARYAGSEVVGFITIADRIVTTLGFVREPAGRISIPALARLQGNAERLKQAVEEGTVLQLAALGLPLVLFAWTGPWVLPLLFGDEWTPVLQVYPLIAFAFLTSTFFRLHSSALYVLGRNWSVTVFHAAHVALFISAAFVLVPRTGLVGYGWAEIIGLGGYALVHWFFVQAVGRPDYRAVALWWAVFAFGLFGAFTLPLALLALGGVVLWPPTRRQLLRILGTVEELSPIPLGLDRLRPPS